MPQSTVIPWKAVSGVTSLGSQLPGWRLHEVPHDTPLDPRTFTTRVDFSHAFQVPPVVHTSLVGFDIDRHESQRISVSAANITTTGFDLALTTWMASRIYSVEVSWLALGS